MSIESGNGDWGGEYQSGKIKEFHKRKNYENLSMHKYLQFCLENETDSLPFRQIRIFKPIIEHDCEIFVFFLNEILAI